MPFEILTLSLCNPGRHWTQEKLKMDLREGTRGRHNGASKSNWSGENYCSPSSLMGGNCTGGRNDWNDLEVPEPVRAGGAPRMQHRGNASPPGGMGSANRQCPLVAPLGPAEPSGQAPEGKGIGTECPEERKKAPWNGMKLLEQSFFLLVIKLKSFPLVEDTE